MDWWRSPWWRRNLFRETERLFRSTLWLENQLLNIRTDIDKGNAIRLEAAKVKAEEDSLPKRINVMSTRLHNLESDYVLVMRRLEWWEKKCKLVQQGKTDDQIIGNIGPEP